MNQKTNPDHDSKIWAIIGKLLNGKLAMLQIRKNLESVVFGSDFIAKYLEPCGNTICRIPCNDCDEGCDNEKWVKHLSDGSIVKVCPSHPGICDDLLVEDIAIHRIRATFFYAIAAAMKLQNIPTAFAGNDLVYIGNWNKSNYFAAVYVSRIGIPKFSEAAITKLLSKKSIQGADEKITIIVPSTDILSAEATDLLRKHRSKCFSFSELLTFNNNGDLLFITEANSYFSLVDMTKLVNQRSAFIEYKEIGGRSQWYIQGQPTEFKRTKRSVHFKMLNLLAAQYNAAGDWVPHEIIRTEVGWVEPSKYWGNGKDNSGQAQKVISDLRRELGIQIDYDREKGFKISGTVKS